MKSRYPGAKPFTEDEKNIFYGREVEKLDILRLIKFEQVVLIFGKSGYGKSSLISASILPTITEKGDYKVFNIRLGSWVEDKKESPTDICRDVLTPKSGIDSVLNKIIPYDTSLWTSLKSEQIKSRSNKFLLVFDQFEELFSYPEPLMQDFKSQITETLVVGMPQRFRKNIENLLKTNKQEIENDILDILYEPIEIKIIFAIRSDRMHLLTKLTDYIPNLLRNTYELKSLSRKDAYDALVEPARAEGNFTTTKFEYSPDVCSSVLNFLEDKEGRVEAIQLQIIAESFEAIVKNEKLDLFTIEKMNNINDIINNYYKSKINSIPEIDERNIASKLIEDGLVLEGEKQRLSLHEGQIRELFNVTPSLLQRLEESRLLRAEPVQRGGYAYELAHDTLIEPVLKSKRERHNREEEEKRKKVAKEHEIKFLNERAKRVRARKIAFFSTILSLISLFSALIAYKQYVKAEKEKNTAEQATIAAQYSQKIAEENFTKYKSEIILRLLSEANKFKDADQYFMEQEKLNEIILLDTTHVYANKRLQEINKINLSNQ